MSINSMLQGTSKLDKEFQSIMKQHIPSKSQFKAIFNNVPFSTDEPLVPYTLKNSAEAGLVGTAFDYLARAMIANTLKKGKNDSWQNLRARLGLERIARYVDESTLKILKQKYITDLANYIDYIYSDYSQISVDFESSFQEDWEASVQYFDRAIYSSFQPITNVFDIISDAVFFAKLEQVYRNGGLPPKDGIDSLCAPPSEHVFAELKSMCQLFQERFIEKAFVMPDSKVIFNPSFGIFSLICGGADADVYIDGTLFDFKTGKQSGYRWQEVAQLVAYYFLNELMRELYCATQSGTERCPAQLIEYNICNIAFYRARMGEIEFCKTEDLNPKLLEDLFDYFNIKEPQP